MDLSRMASSANGAIAEGLSIAPYASVLESLQQWRENPDDSQIDKRVQQISLEWLLSQEDKHWFCSHDAARKSSPDYKKALFDVATFTVRLIGFKATNKVLDWKLHVEHLLQTCPYCVRGWLRAQKEVGQRYLKSKWPESTVANWYTSLYGRELERVKNTLVELSSDSKAFRVVLFNILCDSHLYSDENLISIIERQLPEHSVFEDVAVKDLQPPAGIILWTVHSKPKIRQWASAYLSDQEPLSLEAFEDPSLSLASAVFTLFEHITRRDEQISATQSPLTSKRDNFSFTTDDVAYWQGLQKVLTWLSDEVFNRHFSGSSRRVDGVRIVASHLGDKGEHWLQVVDVFRIFLERLDDRTWNTLLDNASTAEASGDREGNIDAGYAGARLHDALDNQRFLQELRNAKDVEASQQTYVEESLFGWIYFFLRSLRSSQFFHPCFSIVCNRLLDEYGRKALYDEDLRLRTLKATFKLFNLVFKQADSDEDGNAKWLFQRVARSDLERRATLLAETAFPSESNPGALALKASRAAQSLFHTLASTDSQALQSYVYKLAKTRDRLKTGERVPLNAEHAPHVCQQLYDRAASQMELQFSPAGAAGFVKALARSAHVARLSSRAWSIKDAALFDKYIKRDLKLVNEQKEIFSKPICSMLRSLANEDAQTIQDFLKIDGVAESISMLILCPTESIATQAQSVLRQGYDVSSRIECLRSLIENHPEASLKGVINALRSFRDNATGLPEACEQAKRLVRCLTDVISILCDPTDVMIRSEQWVEKNKVRGCISKLWNLMCTDIALIFEKTEHWAPAFENEEMTTWMRDALIFLKEMLDEVRTFEAAASGTSYTSDNPTPRKMSTRGREMVNALNEPLAKMIAWLRLNDRDLLEQTTAVTVQLLDRFAKAGLPVNDDAVKRIRKLADKLKDPKSRKDQLLRPEHIQALVGALARHSDYADEFAQFLPSAKQGTMKAEWGRIFKSKPGSSEPSGQANPIDLVSDESSDDAPTVVSAIKRGTTGSSVSKVSMPRSQASKISADRLKAKSTPSKVVSSSSSKRVQPPVPSARYKTAPTRMKNAIYSHAAMRAAQGHTSSDDSGEEGQRAGLAGFEQPVKVASGVPARLAKPIHVPQSSEQRKAKLLDLSLNTVQDPHQPATGRKRGERIVTAAELAVQSQNKARMRYNPDYSDLHRRILQWNLSQQGPTPDPSFRWPQRIPSSFEDADEYINTFLPLLLLECWSELTTAKEEIQNGDYELEPFTGVLAGRVTVDDFTEVFISVDRLTERNAVTENDIVMLTGPCQTIGKIHQVIRKQQKIDVVIRCHLGKDDGTVSRSLMNGTQWAIRKLFSLSTVHREYGGLMSLPYYDLLDEILQPTRHGKPEMDAALVDRAMKAYRVNRPQAAAILGAMSTLGFSLIQGPPGTGKTKTILGLVGAFISNRGHRAIITGASLGPGGGSGSKMLVCAPSNAAVDEIAKRLKDGVYDSEGRKFVPKVVRVGSESAVHSSVTDIFLDTLVEKALGGTSGKTAAGEAQANLATVRTELQNLRAERDDKRNEKASVVNNTALLSKLNSEISGITQRINDLGDQLDRERDKLTQSNRAMETSKRKARAEILASADVICSTLSGAGHDYLANFDFETVIIDEAAQSVEISSLIPLKYNCQRCIMVGDPNQLPPTVKSKEATKAGYNKSLFVRLHTAAPEATHLLSIQYRMHPDISSFPSKAFYESRLADGPNMDVITRQAWHDTSDLFPPYVFLHVRGSKEEKGKHHSLINRQEASVAVALYARLVQECKGIDLSQKVGIVTAYKAQVGELRKQFRNRFGPDIMDKIDFNTVDGFQGQEKDIIILSCVRGGNGEGSGIGFLSDVRRMNVALTRAKSSLFILGDAQALQSNDSWRKLVQDAKDRGALREVDSNSFTLRSATAPAKIASPSRKSTVTKGKKRESDASKLTILPAPEGLMKPSELARSTSSLNVAEGASKASGLGVKKRLMESMKGEDHRNGTLKRIKTEEDNLHDLPSNASDTFTKPVIKKEDSPEEGEVMEGIEYTNNEVIRFPISGPSVPNGIGPNGSKTSAIQPKEAPKLAAPAQQQSRGPPVLVAPSKPSSSMFIPRKKVPLPPKSGGPPKRF